MPADGSSSTSNDGDDATCIACLAADTMSQVTALSGYLYKFSKDERRVKLQEALAQFAPPRLVVVSLNCWGAALAVGTHGRGSVHAVRVAAADWLSVRSHGCSHRAVDRC